MEAFVVVGAGFLLAVLWFDLMHDVLVRGHDDELPADGLQTIGGYYRRVTTDAHPMGRMVLVAMLATLVAAINQIARGLDPVWVAWVSAAIVLAAMVLVRVRTFPNAVRIGLGEATAGERSDLARAVYRDHVVCFAGMATVVAVQLWSAAN